MKKKEKGRRKSKESGRKRVIKRGIRGRRRMSKFRESQDTTDLSS